MTGHYRYADWFVPEGCVQLGLPPVERSSMNDLIESVARTLVPGVVVAVVASIVTVRLSLRRFRSEKWWEKKEGSYSRLLDALHHFKEHETGAIDETEGGSRPVDEDPSEWLSEHKRFSREYARLRDLASLHLCDEAVKVLSAYEAKRLQAEKSDNEYDWACIEFDASTDCIERLIRVARKDLDVK